MTMTTTTTTQTAVTRMIFRIALIMLGAVIGYVGKTTHDGGGNAPRIIIKLPNARPSPRLNSVTQYTTLHYATQKEDYATKS